MANLSLKKYHHIEERSLHLEAVSMKKDRTLSLNISFISCESCLEYPWDKFYFLEMLILPKNYWFFGSFPVLMSIEKVSA